MSIDQILGWFLHCMFKLIIIIEYRHERIAWSCVLMRSVFFTNEYWFPESWFGIQRHIYMVCLVSWLIVVCNCGVGRIISFHFHELRGFSTSRGHNTHTDLGLKDLLLPWVTSNLVTCNLVITEDDISQTHSDDTKINVCFIVFIYHL